VSDQTTQQWQMPEAKELFTFINSAPLVQSLLYDINLLPEQIHNARHWNYMVAVCSHMHRALTPASDSADTEPHGPDKAVLSPDTRAYIASLVAEVESLKADAERLDWFEADWRDGVHAEVCSKGDGTTWHAMAPSASVFVGPATFTGTSLRAAIDAARLSAKEPT
jgi:hypothetical protein